MVPSKLSNSASISSSELSFLAVVALSAVEDALAVLSAAVVDAAALSLLSVPSVMLRESPLLRAIVVVELPSVLVAVVASPSAVSDCSVCSSSSSVLLLSAALVADDGGGSGEADAAAAGEEDEPARPAISDRKSNSVLAVELSKLKLVAERLLVDDESPFAALADERVADVVEAAWVD